jgi:C4-dicarboxylate transporter DctM subunit
MSDISIGFTGIGLLLLLMALRVPIAFALFGVAVIGLGITEGVDIAMHLVRIEPFHFAAHWSFSAIPMFILMGCIAQHTRLASELFNAARLWLAWVPGGLAVAANFSCAGFAAASGSSLATAATMGRITIPEMVDAGYDKGLASGVVASAGTVGNMIPPSITFIIFGIFAEVSVTKLFMAGIFPGLLTISIYACVIIVRCWLKPALAPRTTLNISWSMRFRSLLPIWPIFILIVSLLIGFYQGYVTATEGGAFGAFVLLIISILQKRMTRDVFVKSISDTLLSTTSLLWIAVGAIMFTRFLAITGTSGAISDIATVWVGSPLSAILVAAVIFLVLGMFLDPMGILLLTLPIVLPMFRELDMNLIWIGVLVVKFIEIGLLTPPVGMNVYAIKNVVDDTISLGTIFKGTFWFLACEVVVVSLLIYFPQISLFIPGLLN